ncbi:MAG: M12 family metallo-peptidase [Candidatus Cloacimonetes bacterium]|nr:M12 family metallo-peptidase [Candidatus Cloacimonadota bacterium]
MKLYKPFFLTIIIVIMLICSLTGQTNIDINANLRIFEAEESSDPATIKIFQEVDRYRNFDFNQDLRHLNARNVGQTMNLTFFEDKQYTADILKAEVNDAGRTVITAKILESDFGYAIIIVSEDTITISAKVQENDEFFFASVKNGQAYLGQARLSEMAKDELPCGVIDEPQYCEHIHEDECETTRNDVVIDLLYVYTPAAEIWALNDWRVTDIHHLIDVALASSNYVVSNSETGITFNIVHRHLTNYVEDDSGEDLMRLTDPYDGYMDEVHVLRNQYGADLVVFVPEVSFTGGVAWLLWSFDGFEPDNYAVSLNRVQQSSWSYTIIHEIGHNMGAHHHRDQNFQEGPNWNLGGYSAGWRGYVQNVMRNTVMAYGSGGNYEDGINSYDIPYFSSPLINLHGTNIGNATLADNARLLRETKAATAGYRNRPINYIYDLSAEFLKGSSSISVNNPVTYTMRVRNFGTNEAIGFTINLMEVKNFMPVATIMGDILLPGEYMDFELTWIPTHIDQTQVWGHIGWDLDENHNNNNTSVIFVTIHPSGILLSENFDSDASYFELGWDGMINSSSGIFENSGVDGSKALATVVWEHSERQYATTPEIGPINTDTILSFSYRIINYTTDWYAPVTPYFLESDDVVYIEIEAPGLHIPFTSIYIIDNLVHIPSPDFAIINLPLSDFIGEYVTIRFYAIRGAGTWFFVLDDVSVTGGEITLFNPPRNLTAKSGNRIVDLTWDAPANGSSGTLTEYRLYRGISVTSLSPLVTIPLPTQTYQDTELTNGTNYFYQITAIYNDLDGESVRSPTTPVQATPFIWNPPRDLSLFLGNGQVALNWQVPEYGGAILSGYKIYRGTTIENMTQIHNITTNLSPDMSWVNDTDLIEGESYYYGIKASYSAPEAGDSDLSNIENSGPVSDEDKTLLPTMTALEGNFPNPFNPETMIRFSLAAETFVSIDIYNIRGQRIKRILEDSFERGFHSVVWNGTDDNNNSVSSGMYFYRMIAGEYSEVRRMVLMK